MRQLFLFMVCLTYLSSCCASYNSYLRTTDKTCNEDVNGYCSDCLTQTLCGSDDSTSEVKCEEGSVCSEFGWPTLTACVDASTVEKCECPEGASGQMPDKYDDNKFIVCVNGNPAIVKCDDMEYYNPDLESCQSLASRPTTLRPPITTPIPGKCPNDETFSAISVSCTQYKFCYPDNTFSETIDCDPGQIFSSTTFKCEDYQPFSCPDSEEDGFYADTTNCSIYHTCYEGEQIGKDNICANEEVFDPVTNSCTETTSKCTAVEDCGICPDVQTRFPIDCKRYYQCTEDAEGKISPIIRECPNGFAYDAVTGFCELENVVEGCPA